MLRDIADPESKSSVDAAMSALRILLRKEGSAADQQWRRWAYAIVDIDVLSSYFASRLWQEILEFDSTLSGHVSEPIPLDAPAVVVAGSGKESFKTFNVSTAASILAAASGAVVVKGVSRSVSAVSGSADVLKFLGLQVVNSPVEIPEVLESNGIVFVSYSAFCPTYAGRYDGVFRSLSPFSFFMPVAVLGVQAFSFIYGIAHQNVSLAADAIRAVRPDLKRGVVVATELSPHEVMDEWGSYGTTYSASLDEGRVRLSRGTHRPVPAGWRSAVAHRSHHRANAELLTSSLAPDGCPSCADLVERNAALIVAASLWGQMNEETALSHVRRVRMAGKAARLLVELRDSEGRSDAS